MYDSPDSHMSGVLCPPAAEVKRGHQKPHCAPHARLTPRVLLPLSASFPSRDPWKTPDHLCDPRNYFTKILIVVRSPFPRNDDDGVLIQPRLEEHEEETAAAAASSSAQIQTICHVRNRANSHGPSVRPSIVRPPVQYNTCHHPQDVITVARPSSLPCSAPAALLPLRPFLFWSLSVSPSLPWRRRSSASAVSFVVIPHHPISHAGRRRQRRQIVSLNEG